MRSWTWGTQRDRADGSLTPAHTDSHGDYVPEMVPPGYPKQRHIATHAGRERSPAKQQHTLATHHTWVQSHGGCYALLGTATPDTTPQGMYKKETVT